MDVGPGWADSPVYGRGRAACHGSGRGRVAARPGADSGEEDRAESVPVGPCGIELIAKVTQSACPTPASTRPATYVVPVEQHRTRPPQRRQTRPAPLSPLGTKGAEGVAGAPGVAGANEAKGAGGASAYRVMSTSAGRGRSVAPAVLALRRLPNPRLTGIGAGLFAAAVMFVIGCADWLLFDGSSAVFGVLFLPVSALTAFWVRPADLVTAPISVPIAFAVGIIPISGGAGGFGGQAMAVVTALAVHAGWLYGGTLVAGLIATVRKVRLMRARQRRMLLAAQTSRPAAQPVAAARPAGRTPRRPSRR